eukprot:13775162-Ditylum_brightwellii.AAC.1
MDALVETRHMVSTTTVKSNKGTVAAVELAKRWGIGLVTARKTIVITTQKIRYYHVFVHNVCTNKLLAGTTCGQLFINDNYHGEFIPMTSKGEAANALDQIFQDLGVPNHIHTDGAKELNLRKWKDVQEKYGGIKQTNTEPNISWQNRAEAGIKELKKHVNRLM